MKVQLISEQDPDGKYSFKCPGCRRTHHVPTKGPSAWQFNGDINKPTFQPSLLSYYEFEGKREKICHSFITNGNIQFLSDCYHTLAGQTVPLPDLPLLGSE